MMKRADLLRAAFNPDASLADAQMRERSDDLTEDDIAEVLSRMLPMDGNGKEGHWAAANKFAAAELIKAMPKLREEAATSKWSHRRDLGWLMAKKAREYRNDYLAKAG